MTEYIFIGKVRFYFIVDFASDCKCTEGRQCKGIPYRTYVVKYRLSAVIPTNPSNSRLFMPNPLSYVLVLPLSHIALHYCIVVSGRECFSFYSHAVLFSAICRLLFAIVLVGICGVLQIYSLRSFSVELIINQNCITNELLHFEGPDILMTSTTLQASHCSLLVVTLTVSISDEAQP